MLDQIIAILKIMNGDQLEKMLAYARSLAGCHGSRPYVKQNWYVREDGVRCLR